MIDLKLISPSHLVEYHRTIAKWTRLSGTAEERAAAAYVEGQLREFGYTTQILVHDAYISLPGPATLRMTAPESREIFCITHSMGVKTDPSGVIGELVYVGKGTPDEYARAGAKGKVALVDDMATPEQAVEGTRAGVRGLIFISGRHAHEMCVSPIWGNPAASTIQALPRIPLLSVHRADGEMLRELCAKARVDVHMTAAVETKWTNTPIVIADLRPGHSEADPEQFVLFSGHLDGWHLGAMDNGSANATMLEVARVLASRRADFRRGLRLAFWSGHSHGRYSSSAWYVDHHWFDLAEHCVAHVNIDSVGGIAADRFVTNSMPETLELGAWAVRQVAQAELNGKRVGRDSDQSFLGVGIPSILGSLSHQTDGSLGWWWHTPHDTVDKIDPVRLVRDAKIFALVVDRWLSGELLPLNALAGAADLRASLEGLAREAGSAFDLSAATAAAVGLEDACGRLQQVSASAAGVRAREINACLLALCRTLIPATYTSAGRFSHDPALDNEFLPRLAAARRLASLPRESDAARFLLVDLVRGRNAVIAALREARAAVERCLARVS
ncbi:MAG TPA: M28 family peptidase [bacterium]|nr:M28 family peptidase [bacterium]